VVTPAEWEAGDAIGCHRPRISDRIIFDRLPQLLRFGCSYEATADPICSASTIRNRRDEWIALGVFARLKQIAWESYDRNVGLILDQIAVEGSVTKAPGGGEGAGRSRSTVANRAPNARASRTGYGIPLGRVLAGANRHDSLLLAPTLDRLDDLGSLPDDITVHLDAGYDSDTTRALLDERGLRGRIAHKGERARRYRHVRGGTWSAPAPGRAPSTGSPAAANAGPLSSTPSSTWPISVPESPAVGLQAVSYVDRSSRRSRWPVPLDSHLTAVPGIRATRAETKLPIPASVAMVAGPFENNPEQNARS
jgi:hypothetical protein